MATETKPVPIEGGLDLVNPPMKRPGGLLQSVQNFRNDQEGGIQRIGGYERFDGKAGPTDAVYYNLNFNFGSVEPEVGQTLVGGTSGTAAVVLSYVVTSGDWSTCDAAGTIYAVSVNGDFIDGESIDASSNGGFSNGFSSGFELGISPNICGKFSSVGDSGGVNPTFFNYRASDWQLLADASPMPTGETNVVEYNAAGTLLAIGNTSAPRLIIYNAATLTSISGPASPPTLQVDALAFNTAGTLLATGYGTTVRVYETSTWGIVTTLTASGEVEDLDFNNADSLLAVAVGFGSSTYLELYNTSTWTTIAGPSTLPEGWGTAVDFSPDDSLLAVANDFGTTRNITIYNTSTWAKLADPAGVTTDKGLDCIFNNAQTELLLVKATSNYFVRWSTSTWTILGSTPTLPNQPTSIAINDDDSNVAIGIISNTPSLVVYETSTWGLESLSSSPTDRQKDVAFQPE